MGIIVEQRHQRVVGFCRQGRGAGGVKIHHQAVAEIGHRRERKHLWIHRLLQIDHHAHGGGGVLAHADVGDIGIVLLHFAADGLQHIIERGALDIHHQPGGVVEREMFVFHGARCFEGDAGVGAGRPDAHGHELRCGGGLGQRGQRGDGEEQAGGGAADNLTAG